MLQDASRPSSQPEASSKTRDRPSRPCPSSNPAVPPLIDFRAVTIRYQENVVLDQLSWTIREGENWIVVGGNGSGKTTLLELITGENLRAYGQDIWLFGRKKGSGESIWDIRRHLGVISTAFHMAYGDFADKSVRTFARSHTKVSTWEVVCSGFFDSIGLYEAVGASQEDIARGWIDRFGLTDLVTPPPRPQRAQVSLTESERPSQDFSHLSFGQQKLVLLCRAMVKHPRVLLLDEPTHGLSGHNRDRLLGMLAMLADDPTVAVVHVTHRQDEIQALGFHNILRLQGASGQS